MTGSVSLARCQFPTNPKGTIPGKLRSRGIVPGGSSPKRIAAITTAHNAGLFLQKWIAHYGAALGVKNLYSVLDGEDQVISERTGANTRRVAHVPATRAQGDRLRAALRVGVSR